MHRYTIRFSYVVMSVLSFSAIAATTREFNLPTDIHQALPSAAFQQAAPQGLLKQSAGGFSPSADYIFIKKQTGASPVLPQFNLMSSNAQKIRHERFVQTYQGLRIIGAELIRHTQNAKQTVTGQVYEGIAQDLPSVLPLLSRDEAMVVASQQGAYSLKESGDRANLAIYIHPQTQTAHLIYEVVHQGIEGKKWVDFHTFVDATTGDILKSWNNAHHYQASLEGKGGSSWTAFHGTEFERPNAYQFVKNPSKPYEFGPLEAEQVSDQECYLETQTSKGLSEGVSTYTVADTNVEAIEKKYSTSIPFSYQKLENLRKVSSVNCQNVSEDPLSVVSNGIPINLYSQQADAHYFATQTQNMFRDWYGVYPFSSRVFVVSHAEFANAFAIPSINNAPNVPDQVWIGNGKEPSFDFYGSLGAGMASADIVSHELGHLVTGRYSDLMYWGQSGGLNESFSDMTAIAMQDFLQQSYSWATYNYFLGGQIWLLSPYYFRSMAQPELDGYSISQSSDYTDELDVHGSSGVFNKVFYNLAEKQHWGVKKAYQLMLTANMNYWDASSNFKQAACGMISAANELGYNTAKETQAIVSSLSEQGVSCSE